MRALFSIVPDAPALTRMLLLLAAAVGARTVAFRTTRTPQRALVYPVVGSAAAVVLGAGAMLYAAATDDYPLGASVLWFALASLGLCAGVTCRPPWTRTPCDAVLGGAAAVAVFWTWDTSPATTQAMAALMAIAAGAMLSYAAGALMPPAPAGRRVARAILDMPLTRRRLMTSVYDAGMTRGQAAASVGMNPSDARLHLYRTRLEMAQALTQSDNSSSNASDNSNGGHND